MHVKSTRVGAFHRRRDALCRTRQRGCHALSVADFPRGATANLREPQRPRQVRTPPGPCCFGGALLQPKRECRPRRCERRRCGTNMRPGADHRRQRRQRDACHEHPAEALLGLGPSRQVRPPSLSGAPGSSGQAMRGSNSTHAPSKTGMQVDQRTHGGATRDANVVNRKRQRIVQHSASLTSERGCADERGTGASSRDPGRRLSSR